MKIHTLLRQQIISRPLAEVFSFFEKPENLARLTPAKLNFKILNPAPILMHEGARIDYSIRLMGLPVRWTTLITLYDPPRMFIDEQVRGPYRIWHHRHEFREHPLGTAMSDEVRYAISFGLFGELARMIYVRGQIEAIFDARRAAISEIFG